MRKRVKSSGSLRNPTASGIFFLPVEISRFADKLQPIKELREMERLLLAPICLLHSRVWQAKWIHALISLAFILMTRHIRAARVGKYYAKCCAGEKKSLRRHLNWRGINKKAVAVRLLSWAPAALWD
jgi:hypothetical protein